MIIKAITYFGQPCAVACDAKCNKAWGVNNRPRIRFDEDDDFAYLADGELGDAPADPGTYEGGCAKPTHPSERLNKWCVRECERSTLAPKDPSKPGELVELRDFSERRYNMPWKHGRNTG
jgi:hypothetical protein